MATTLNELYSNTHYSSAYGNRENLYREARKNGLNVTRHSVGQFLQKQDSFTLFRPVLKHFKTRSSVVRYLNGKWEADLVEVKEYAADNNDIHFLLTVIDSASRKAYVRPLTKKTAQQVSHAFTDILAEAKITPGTLQTDLGKEFYNSIFSKVCSENDIKHYSVPGRKAPQIERFNRKFKGEGPTKFDYYFIGLKVAERVKINFAQKISQKTLRWRENHSKFHCTTKTARRRRRISKTSSIETPFEALPHLFCPLGITVLLKNIVRGKVRVTFATVTSPSTAGFSPKDQFFGKFVQNLFSRRSATFKSIKY